MWGGGVLSFTASNGKRKRDLGREERASGTANGMRTAQRRFGDDVVQKIRSHICEHAFPCDGAAVVVGWGKGWYIPEQPKQVSREGQEQSKCTGIYPWDIPTLAELRVLLNES